MINSKLNDMVDKDMITGHTNCIRCGVCCRYLGLSISIPPGDVERWRNEGRKDIINRLGPERTDGFYEGWIVNGEWATKCPFLKQDKCSIHKTKPTPCAEYPNGGLCLTRRGVN